MIRVSLGGGTVYSSSRRVTGDDATPEHTCVHIHT